MSSMSEEKKNEALYDAVRSGDVGDVRPLLDDGARVDQIVFGWQRHTLLHVAAERGFVSVMELLLEKGGDVDTRNSKGSTPLHIAAEQGYTEVIACIVERGGYVNAKDDNGDTPLHHAASNGEKAAVRCLLDQKCYVDSRNYNGSTPLNIAAKQGHTEVIACIVERGGDVNSTDKDGNTPLYNAASNGNKAAVRCLLDQKCNVDIRNCDGNTPLHGAAKQGHTEVIACMVERGGDVNSTDEDGYTPLHMAARWGYTEVIACIVERGGDVNAKDNYGGDTPLHIAAYNGEKAAVQCLLDQKCNVDTRNSRGSTPLHDAARWGWTEVIACIAERGGDVNSTNEDGDTPIHLAVMKHRTVAVTLLQRYGAEVTLHPRITLLDAILSDCVQLFNLLVVPGADVNAKTGRLKDSLLRRAVRHDSLDIVEELIGRGCDVNAADRKGNTPLHVAAQHGRHGLMKTLVEAGGNVNTQGERDRTPLHVAVCKKKRTCVSALLGLNADTECVDGDGKTARDLSPTKAITKLLSDQSTGGCNVAILTNEQPLVNRKRRHEESIKSPSSKTRQLCHPTVSNVPASSDQPTTEQLLNLQSGAGEEDVFNPRTGDNNLDNAPEAAQIQTSPDLSNTYFKIPYIPSITPVGVNTSTVTSSSQPMMSLLNNTSDEPSSSDYIFSPSDINTSSVTSPSTPQMSGEHGSSVVRDEIHPTTSYKQAEASHLVYTAQSLAEIMHGNATYITTTASSIQKPEDTSDASNLGSMAHSFETSKLTTLTPEKGHVSSSIDLQDDDNYNDWDSFERPNVTVSSSLPHRPHPQSAGDMHLIPSHGKAANMDGIQLPPDQIPTHSRQIAQDQIPTHSREQVQYLNQMHTQPTPDTNRVRPPLLQVAQPGQLAPVQGPPPYRQGKTESTILPLQPDIRQPSMQLTQLQVQCRQQAEEIRRLQDEVVSLKAAKQTPSNQSQAQIRQQAEEIRRLQDEVVSLKAATKPTSNQCQSEVGQLPDTSQIPQPSSRPTPADSPTTEAPLYERPVNKNHYKPTHGQCIAYCQYRIYPAGQSAVKDYEKLAEGSACNVFVPSVWMDEIRKLCMSKPPSYKLKKMVDGLYEPKELYKKKASSVLHDTDLGKALRSYAIDVLKMESPQVTAEFNSKITTVNRRCRQQPELLR